MYKILESTITTKKCVSKTSIIVSKIRRIYLYFLSFGSLIARMFFKIGESSGTSTSKILAKSRREGKVLQVTGNKV